MTLKGLLPVTTARVAVDEIAIAGRVLGLPFTMMWPLLLIAALTVWPSKVATEPAGIVKV